MENIENIKKYAAEIQELDSQWEELLKEAIEGYKDMYRFFMPNTSLHSLGLSFDYDRYCEKKFKLEQKVKNEFIMTVSYMTNTISNIKLPLIDCNIPFKFIVDEDNNRVFPTKVEKIFFYFLTTPYNNFQELQKNILMEKGFFNQSDVIIENAKAPYQTTVKNAKYIFQLYNIIDKKGIVTIIGKGVKLAFNKLLKEDERRHYVINEKCNEELLKHLIAIFFNTEDLDNSLIVLEGKAKLESNLKLIRDTFEKLI